MNTPTHALINWSVAKGIAGDSFPASAVLLGSIAPDIPLYLLSFGGAAWFRWWEGWQWNDIGKHMYGYLFYNDPIWISLHNFLHSPLMLVILLAIVFAVKGRADFLGSWWTWFFASCMLHTLVDIPVHHDDGPLVFWPLNWTYRFPSPVSYWDHDHHAAFMVPAEFGLAALLAVKILYDKVSPFFKAD